jgi:hypothetical protein
LSSSARLSAHLWRNGHVPEGNQTHISTTGTLGGRSFTEAQNPVPTVGNSPD